MASQTPKSGAAFLLFLNLLMYSVLVVISGWVLNYGIDKTPEAVTGISTPAQLFPIYYPLGNMATGFFVIFALVASLAGIASSLTGLHDVLQWRVSSLLSAAASSFVAWALTVLAMGLACKEISIGSRSPSLRAMETLTIILSGTQLLTTGAIHGSITAAATGAHYNTGRV